MVTITFPAESWDQGIPTSNSCILIHGGDTKTLRSKLSVANHYLVDYSASDVVMMRSNANSSVHQ